MPRIAVSSSHGLMQHGLSSVLSVHMSGAALDVAAPASARHGSELTGYDLVIVDCLGDHDPSEQVARLVASNGGVLALYDPHMLLPAFQALRAGAAATVPTAASAACIGAAAERIVNEVRVGSRRPLARRRARSADVPYALTRRELDVLLLVGAGRSNAEIAQRLYIGVNTVKSNLQVVYRKIGVHSRTEATIWCFRHGLAPRRDANPALSSTLSVRSA